MEPLYIAILILLGMRSTHSMTIEESMLNNVDKSPSIKNMHKRDLQKEIFNFIKQQLVQHSQALEHIIPMVERNENMTSKLLEIISKQIIKKVFEPEMPDKVEVQYPSRRSNVGNDEENPVEKFGNNIRRTGSLLTNLIWKEIRDDPDPIVLIEKEEDP